MEPDPVFRLFHRYNKLVRRDLVQPLTCGVCDTPLITGVGKEDELVLKCYSCGSSLVPGLATLGRVEAVVKEHFVDD